MGYSCVVGAETHQDGSRAFRETDICRWVVVERSARWTPAFAEFFRGGLKFKNGRKSDSLTRADIKKTRNARAGKIGVTG
jgi:hypothetical protein